MEKRPVFYIQIYNFFAWLYEVDSIQNKSNWIRSRRLFINPYPTPFPYGNGMVLHFYQQQENSTTKTVHKVINKRLKAYV